MLLEAELRDEHLKRDVIEPQLSTLKVEVTTLREEMQVHIPLCRVLGSISKNNVLT